MRTSFLFFILFKVFMTPVINSRLCYNRIFNIWSAIQRKTLADAAFMCRAVSCRLNRTANSLSVYHVFAWFTMYLVNEH